MSSGGEAPTGRERETGMDKAFIRRMLGKGHKQVNDLNKLFESGYRYGTDAWCGHDCLIIDRRTGNPVAWRDGRKVTVA